VLKPVPETVEEALRVVNAPVLAEDAPIVVLLIVPAVNGYPAILPLASS
jgi:hypothetical protein